MKLALRLTFSACLALLASGASAAPAELRALAHEYYLWRDAAYPVASSSNGEHRFDARLTDFRMAAVVDRQRHFSELLAQVRAMSDAGWAKDDRVDDQLISYGSLPVSVIEWLMFDDDSQVQAALH
jgi:uncharacterized protein (DUF885 family)